MKRWLFLTVVFGLIGLPGTMFLVSTLEVSNDVHITATVRSLESESSASSGTPDTAGGRNSGTRSSQSEEDEEDEDSGEEDLDEEEDNNQDDANEASGDEGDAGSNETQEQASAPEPILEEERETIVIFGGYAFPNAMVTFTLDGEVVLTIDADEEGYFEGNYDELAFGEHVFTFQAEDYNDAQTRTVSYAYTVINESPLYISSILLPPLFEPAENGTDLEGLSIPGAEIQVFGVTQDGQDLIEVESIIVDEDGTYSYELNLKDGAFNQYYVSCTYEGKECGYSGIIPVQIVDGAYEIPSNVFADFTQDVEVNFVDFSFMRAAFLSKANLLFYDLDEDGELTLKDFSLLNYQWTQ